MEVTVFRLYLSHRHAALSSSKQKVACPKKAISVTDLTTNKHFFHGSKTPEKFNYVLPDESSALFPVNRFVMMDSTSGLECRRKDTDQTLRFRLLPRGEAIARPCHDKYNLVVRLHEATGKGKTVRNEDSIKRSALHEKGVSDRMYVCPGVKVNQGGRGCISERPHSISTED